MFKINLSEMSTFVRAQADTDVEDAPASTLEVYARAAYRDIQARVFPWPDKKVAYTFTTVAGTPGYGLTSFSGSDMRFVVSVSTATDVLMYVTPEQFRELSTERTGSGSPSVYTVEFSEVRLWPTPNQTETINVSGYRGFAEWPSGSDSPDLPEAFSEAICWYMLARFYQGQEDLELAQYYMRDYENAVNQQISNSLRDSSVSAGPMIFGGDPRIGRGPGYEDWVRRSVEG